MKQKKIVILVVILMLVLGGGTAGVLLWNNHDSITEDTLGANQTYVYGKIEQITGNSMNLALAEPVQVEHSNKKGTFSENLSGGSLDGSSDSNGRPSKGNRGDSSSGSTESGVKQQRFVTTTSNWLRSIGVSNGSQMPEGMPEGMPFDGNSAEAPSSSDNDNAEKDSSGSLESPQNTTVTIYNLTGKKAEYMIPVGTSVTTQLGAVTTFSRLAAGDYVKLLMEKDVNGNDVIVQIWIVG